LKQQGRLLEVVDGRLGSDYSQEQALRLLNVALLCTNTLPTQRPRMSSVVKMLCGQIPIEVSPDDADLTEDLLHLAQSQHSLSNSRSDWSHQIPSSDCSILLHDSKDSGCFPSSSSSSLKLWAAVHGVGSFCASPMQQLYTGEHLENLQCVYLVELLSAVQKNRKMDDDSAQTLICCSSFCSWFRWPAGYAILHVVFIYTEFIVVLHWPITWKMVYPRKKIMEGRGWWWMQTERVGPEDVVVSMQQWTGPI
jgi:hypothetical protein